jgi:hypothetical protein
VVDRDEGISEQPLPAYPRREPGDRGAQLQQRRHRRRHG